MGVAYKEFLRQNKRPETIKCVIYRFINKSKGNLLRQFHLKTDLGQPVSLRLSKKSHSHKIAEKGHNSLRLCN